ncbi:MAG: hypothetical protein UR34_C0022G0006 [candidate division WS6 bacterium GW2011_GWC1_33_20]|uniref:Serine protease n=1 Tax=candidate division WS6 bacterium GW2011_GWC1_33_20 TaxID=1619089 RepID=A0A0F9ZGA9_9BACT|nr:MAG: hypothetical protein UR34_C0022G0006 [candidate division WS6 bacterium GW2011_GWC1_33_20]KKP43299.1 MAG: hypothetical protein UR32_C0002G0029 [candidate division WS6 bacterium GW2011_GWE2_33_157]KKP45767.1 MAG: hypothetical protein UR36_C0004G0028 [candidate division WS6 bacterium GW2011_GWF1_33_233]KKP55210.1 MAG: hypothetical protein UR45_C0003G0028 [candidate division WS6 bacterium GW2011_WS6_33_547]KKP57094.1 MAG: hypothetical protein UR49_C0003G0028 [candidate division WS6 bacteriu
MTTWQEIQKEMQTTHPDIVRRGKYQKLVEITKRPLIVYASAFTQPTKNQYQNLMALDLSDKDGFEEVTRRIDSPSIDILLHSPGGSAEATESIVRTLRSRFSNIRFIITGVAKSAATMLALSGDSIILTRAAELGPIDPQIRVRNRFSAAGSIIEQFETATKQIKSNPESLPAWIPILQEYAPCLLVDCKNYTELAESLVRTWMKDYMFKGESTKATKAKIKNIAHFLTNEKQNLSHARRIGYDELYEIGVKVSLAEEVGTDFADALNDVHLSLVQTLHFSDAVKIFENSNNEALIYNIQTASLPLE